MVVTLTEFVACNNGYEALLECRNPAYAQIRCYHCGAQMVRSPGTLMTAAGEYLCKDCARKIHKLESMIGKHYWLHRNGRGWGRVLVLSFRQGLLAEVRDMETDDLYPVCLESLRSESSLTARERLAAGL